MQVGNTLSDSIRSTNLHAPQKLPRLWLRLHELSRGMLCSAAEDTKERLVA